jgi:uncharacterized protein (DUF1778 family)
VRQNSLNAAKAVIEEAERLEISERDSLRVLALLEGNGRIVLAFLRTRQSKVLREKRTFLLGAGV